MVRRIVTGHDANGRSVVASAEELTAGLRRQLVERVGG